jgi:hypothetical protein
MVHMAQKRRKERITAAPKLLYPRQLLAKLLKSRQIKVPRIQVQTLSIILDTVFFASLMVEESEAVRVGVVHAPEGSAELETMLDESPPNEDGIPTWDVTRISPIDLSATSLAKFSRALEYGKQLAIIAGVGRRLQIEGIARRLPRTDGGSVTRIAAPRPGVLVFERGFDELFRFNAGVHDQPRVDVLGEPGPVRDAIAGISGVTRGPTDGYSRIEWALKQLLPRIRSHGAGAIIAMLPTPPSSALVEAIKYRRSDPTLLARRISAEDEQQWSHLWKRIDASGADLSKEKVHELEFAREEAERARHLLDAALDDLAHLSAVDGAIVIGPELAVYGGGYLVPSIKAEDHQIVDRERRAGVPERQHVTPYSSREHRARVGDRRAVDRGASLPERVEASDASAKTTWRYEGSHGARHKAAFSFACNHPGGVAFVVSEDGPVNCIMKVDERLVIWPVQMLET